MGDKVNELTTGGNLREKSKTEKSKETTKARSKKHNENDIFREKQTNLQSQSLGTLPA